MCSSDLPTPIPLAPQTRFPLIKLHPSFYSEKYDSNAMLAVHEKLQHKAGRVRELGDTLNIEYIVVMVYSDSTHFINVGTAAL